jgi:hypothetical protein
MRIGESDVVCASYQGCASKPTIRMAPHDRIPTGDRGAGGAVARGAVGLVAGTNAARHGASFLSGVQVSGGGRGVGDLSGVWV